MYFRTYESTSTDSLEGADGLDGYTEASGNEDQFSHILNPNSRLFLENSGTHFFLRYILYCTRQVIVKEHRYDAIATAMLHDIRCELSMGLTF
jgi:hypothetical protein